MMYAISKASGQQLAISKVLGNPKAIHNFHLHRGQCPHAHIVQGSTVLMCFNSLLTYYLLPDLFEDDVMFHHSSILNTQLCLWHRANTYLTDEQKFETGLWESYKEGKLEQ